MTDVKLIAAREKTEPQRWTIRVEDFATFRQTLGTDVLNAFSRCFVHADRLTSLIGFVDLSEKRHGTDSRPFSRDLQTTVWFAVGTLRELALAVRDLRSALAKRDRLDPTSASWMTLQQFEQRWEDDSFYRNMRNIVAFHIDPDMTEKGLEALSSQGRVVLFEGEGERQQNASLRLGLEALFMGCDLDIHDFKKFVTAVGNDQGISTAVQKAFLLALKDAGIPLVEEEHGA